jgi:uncharacterized protein YdeI (YjbR/CyaY-like superfamily)
MAAASRTRRTAARGSRVGAGRAPRASSLARRALEAARALNEPAELEQALRDDPAARSAYGAMPPSHRKAYVEFIEEAKRPETRVRRVQQALRMMAQWGAEHAKRRTKRR